MQSLTFVVIVGTDRQIERQTEVRMRLGTSCFNLGVEECGSCVVWEMRCVEVAMCGSSVICELQCLGVVVCGSCDMWELPHVGVAVCGSFSVWEL